MAPLKSWLNIDSSSHFSIHNLPFGIISTARNPNAHVAVAIGDYALDLHTFAQHNGFASLSIIQPHQAVFSQSTLNAFAALGRPMHRVVREYLQSVLLENGPFSDILQNNDQLRQLVLTPLKDCQMHLPMAIGDYTDFYAGLHHAYNVGVLFRGPQNALQPNYKYLPVGYHGRASSVVVSGTPITRPNGQILLDPGAETKHPSVSPSRKLDIELELGCFVCKPSALGQPVGIDRASEHLFGMVLMNDWSARDIQAWEYVPLGPFNSKNFGTTISPWVVLMDALEPFATVGIENEVPQMPYLDERDRNSHFAIDLAVNLTTGSGKTSQLSKTSAKNLLFSFPQMLAHHTLGGCPFNVGDLMGSGTISGKSKSEKGCLLEQTENGKVEVELEGGKRRKFLEDGDVVSISGACGEPGALVGFGECVGEIHPAPVLQ
ncbi:Fumarylacetoacetase [Hortaea werneckii]|nr:Fumarylacetoacetase [Hortaea werneckii]KAI6887250.1 Fumarylacetoacetase [Hortaea werneckii]KAI6997719.1 Fumarylacetoacetase [Hortaea werneckii]KAI7088922.1 Fumarylacetoacetase [Hortaea werneckii]KAI7148739.1 Fumarylacetoacetase [Hortaea werneckii]